MEEFSTLLEAAQLAVRRCNHWRFATSDETYNINSLLGIAEISDEENPAEEDSFYVVSTYGSIGFCEDGADIDWLFVSGSSAVEDLPISSQTATQFKFCPKCGSAVIFGSRFCGKCGGALC